MGVDLGGDMKGMMSLLERAGLVRQDAADASVDDSSGDSETGAVVEVGEPVIVSVVAVEQ